MENFEKTEANYSKFVVAYESSNCRVCSINTFYINESFSYKESLSTNGSITDLCVGCLELELGRKLNRSDFMDAPINYFGKASPRLYNRLGDTFSRERSIDSFWMEGVPEDHGEDYVLAEKSKRQDLINKISETQYFSSAYRVEGKLLSLFVFNESELWKKFSFTEKHGETTVMKYKDSQKQFTIKFNDSYEVPVKIKTPGYSLKLSYVAVNSPVFLKLLESFFSDTNFDTLIAT